MIKLPSPIRIGALKYEVRFEEGLATIAGANGVCGQDIQLILVDTQVGPDALRETVLHEALHGIAADSGLHALFEKLEKATSQDELEETVVLEFGKRIMSLLRDNPRLVRFLTAP